jgi:hypothetical protein
MLDVTGWMKDSVILSPSVLRTVVCFSDNIEWFLFCKRYVSFMFQLSTILAGFVGIIDSFTLLNLQWIAHVEKPGRIVPLAICST